MKSIRIAIALGTITASSLAFAGSPTPPPGPFTMLRHMMGLLGVKPLHEPDQHSIDHEETPTKLVSPARARSAAAKTTIVASGGKAASMSVVKAVEAAKPSAAIEIETKKASSDHSTASPSTRSASSTGSSSLWDDDSPSDFKSSYYKSSYKYERPKAAYEQLPAHQRVHFETLLKQVDRPTLAQMKKAMRAAYGNKMPTENPFGEASYVKGESTLIADMVAQLEHAFPGGQWLPLGRDAVLIADALDGFYTSIGQTGRVRRLDMSGNSLPHYRDANPRTHEEDRPMIYGFLKSNGLDLEHLEGKPPYVMIDVTSYRSDSQSTQLMRSVYRTWTKDLGRDPKALYDRVNFIGTPMGGPTTNISDARDIAATKSRLRDGTGTDGPKELLYLGGAMSQLTYKAFWHDDFLKMYKRPDGTITADAGRAYDTEDKNKVLAELYEVDQITSSPTFLAQVKKIAEDKYGYAFPSKQTEKLTRFAPKAPVISASKEYVSTRSESVGASKTVVGAKRVRALLEQLPTAFDKKEMARDILRDLADLWGKQALTRHDVKDKLREIQKHVDMNAPRFASVLREVYEDVPSFRGVVDRAIKNK